MDESLFGDVGSILNEAQRFVLSYRLSSPQSALADAYYSCVSIATLTAGPRRCHLQWSSSPSCPIRETSALAEFEIVHFGQGSLLLTLLSSLQIRLFFTDDWTCGVAGWKSIFMAVL